MKKEILKISRDLIRAQGFDQVSYRDLSKIVGIKTSSIHYYFPTKVDLAIGLVQEENNLLVDRLTGLRGLNPLDRLKGVISLFSQTLEQDFFCVCGILSIRVISPELTWELKKFFETLESFIWECLETSHREDKKLIAFEVVSLLEGALLVARVKRMNGHEYEKAIFSFLDTLF